jgi:hypothetical protein
MNWEKCVSWITQQPLCFLHSLNVVLSKNTNMVSSFITEKQKTKKKDGKTVNWDVNFEVQVTICRRNDGKEKSCHTIILHSKPRESSMSHSLIGCYKFCIANTIHNSIETWATSQLDEASKFIAPKLCSKSLTFSQYLNQHGERREREGLAITKWTRVNNTTNGYMCLYYNNIVISVS